MSHTFQKGFIKILNEDERGIEFVRRFRQSLDPNKNLQLDSIKRPSLVIRILTNDWFGLSLLALTDLFIFMYVYVLCQKLLAGA